MSKDTWGSAGKSVEWLKKSLIHHCRKDVEPPTVIGVATITSVLTRGICVSPPIPFYGNGRIDTGAELFGVDTLIAEGQTATDGFAALKPLDQNHDNRIDSQDAIYQELHLWRDHNQDGHTDAGELQTLTEAGIASIQLAATPANTDLRNGNRIIATGAYTTTDGQTRQAGNLGLAQNVFWREYKGTVSGQTRGFTRHYANDEAWNRAA